MADPTNEQVVVTVNDQHLATIQTVANALRSAGMTVTNVMPTTGVITGEVSKANLSSLTSVPGVDAVEPDQEMHAI